jgi:hypothetical protein
MKISFCKSLVVLSGLLFSVAGIGGAAPVHGFTHKAGLNLPLPNPNSPKSPFVKLNLPLPDPNSPKSPFCHLNLPLPNPNSSKSPF